MARPSTPRITKATEECCDNQPESVALARVCRLACSFPRAGTPRQAERSGRAELPLGEIIVGIGRGRRGRGRSGETTSPPVASVTLRPLAWLVLM